MTYSGDDHCQVFLPAVLWINTQIFKFPINLVLYSQKIGPLQLAIHEVQNRHTGEQSRAGTRKNKRHTVPVRLLFSSKAVLYHVNG